MAPLERPLLHFAIFLLALVLSGSQQIPADAIPAGQDPAAAACVQKMLPCQRNEYTCSDIQPVTTCLDGVEGCETYKQLAREQLAQKAKDNNCEIPTGVVPGDCQSDFRSCNGSLQAILGGGGDQSKSCKAFHDFVKCVKDMNGCEQFKDLIVTKTKETMDKQGCAANTGTGCRVTASLATVMVALVGALFCQDHLQRGGRYIFLPLVYTLWGLTARVCD